MSYRRFLFLNLLLELHQFAHMTGSLSTKLSQFGLVLLHCFVQFATRPNHFPTEAVVFVGQIGNSCLQCAHFFLLFALQTLCSLMFQA